jgi:hypothetical protein
MNETPTTEAPPPWVVAHREQLTNEYLVLKAVLRQLDERFTSLANRAREAGLVEITRSAASLGGQLGEMAG